jgi:HlyD family secretion protein
MFAILLLAACTPPGGKSAEATPASFEVTPYQSTESTTTPVPSGESSGATATGTSAESGVEPSESAATSAPTSTATPEAALLYKGEISPVDRVTVIAEVGGMVLQMNADVSDQLQAGDVIAIIDSAMLEAQRAQALAGLAAAQAQLDLTLDTADEEDLAAAKAGVAAASAAYQRALAGPTEEEQRMALAQLKQAEAAVHVAQAAYNRVKGNPLIGGMPESMQLQQATLAVEAAQAQYDKLLKGATADVIAGAYAQLTQARAQLNRLEEGAKDAQKDAARAQVKQAETALYLAQLQLDKATVHAPIDGIVSQVHTTEGAMVGPGTPILTLRSEDVEVTIAVEENRMEEIEIGQEARIQVEAYPDRIFQGEVIRIASELNPSTRTVAVTIQPTEDASDLLPGMFATVELLK